MTQMFFYPEIQLILLEHKHHHYTLINLIKTYTKYLLTLDFCKIVIAIQTPSLLTNINFLLHLFWFQNNKAMGND